MTSDVYPGIHPDEDPGFMEDDRSDDPSLDTESVIIDPDVEISDAYYGSQESPKLVIDAQLPLPGDPPSHEDDYLRGFRRGF